MFQSHPPTLGVVLAGGLARRMGGADKPLLPLNGCRLLDHVIGRLRPQCATIVINANENFQRFDDLALPVVPDSVHGHPGPLAGILAALEWTAATEPSIAWVVSSPCDTPFLPDDLVARLHQTRVAAGKALACASSTSGTHHAVGLWPVDLRHELRNAIAVRKMRRIRDWTEEHGCTQSFWTGEAVDPFYNVNTPSDLTEAEALARKLLETSDGRT